MYLNTLKCIVVSELRDLFLNIFLKEFSEINFGVWVDKKLSFFFKLINKTYAYWILSTRNVNHKNGPIKILFIVYHSSTVM